VQEKVAPSGRGQPSASIGSAEGPCEGEGGAVGVTGGWRCGGGWVLRRREDLTCARRATMCAAPEK